MTEPSVFYAEVPLKRKRGRPPGKQQTTATLQDPHADDSPKSIWPTNDTGKIQAATKKKRGRPQGSTRRGKPTAAALQQNCATDAQRGTPAAEQAAGMKNGDSHQSQAAEPNAEQATVAGPTDGKTDAIAGPSTDSMANGYTDSRADHQLESSSAMVRNASTGDGSRLVRNHRDTDSETIDSAVEATGAAQSAHSPGKAVPMLQNGQAAAEQAQDCLQRKEDRASGAAGAITSGTADKLRHRLSRVTGMCDHSEMYVKQNK